MIQRTTSIPYSERQEVRFRFQCDRQKNIDKYQIFDLFDIRLHFADISEC
jgi:hypothetical protein